MVQKNSPTIFDHPQPALFADLEGLELGEALQSAPHSEPGDQYTGQQQNRRPRNQRFSPAAARPDQNRQQAELHQESRDPAAGGGQEERADRQDGEQGRQRQQVSPHCPEHQDGQPRRRQQLNQSGKVVAVDVRPEGDAAVAQFAHPVELSIEGEMLDDPKDGNDKAQRQQEPDEAPPLLERAKRLHRQKEQNQIGRQHEEFYLGQIEVHREAGQVLHEHDGTESGQRPEQRVPSHLDPGSANSDHGPYQQQRSGAYLQDRPRPGLDRSVREHGESHQRADAYPNGFHGNRRAASRAMGTRETSSTQTVPRSLLSNFELGSRRRPILTRRVRGPAVKSASSSAQGCVPTRFGVSRLRSPGRRGSEMEKRMPLSVESSSMRR